VVGKGYRRVVQILSTHVCKYKNDTCWNIAGMGEEMKESCGVQYVQYIVITFVNDIMYPHPTQQ
jgi:hypothetical protein